MGYNITKKVNLSFEETISRLTAALQHEGFGILTEIDLKSKFKEKLNQDFRKYKIFGACNPQLAFEAISKEPNIGVMLPCNVLVQESEKGTEVSAINPMESIGVVGGDQLTPIASRVTDKLKAALEQI